MKKILKYVLKELILFLIGGSAYYLTEILFRGYSHISMFIVLLINHSPFTKTRNGNTIR